MTKLYYTDTSCGAASFMAAKAAGLKFEAEQVDLRSHRTLVGDVDFYTINPKGNVPCLVLDDGTVLNENVASLFYIGEMAKDEALLPSDAAGKAKVLNALSFVATEWHQTLGGLFNPKASDEMKAAVMEKIATKLTYMNDQLLPDKTFVTGDTLSVADFYLYVALTWTFFLKVDISPYPVVEAYFNAMSEHADIKAGKEAMATKPTHTN